MLANNKEQLPRKLLGRPWKRVLYGCFRLVRNGLGDRLRFFIGLKSLVSNFDSNKHGHGADSTEQLFCGDTQQGDSQQDCAVALVLSDGTSTLVHGRSPGVHSIHETPVLRLEFSLAMPSVSAEVAADVPDDETNGQGTCQFTNEFKHGEDLQ